VEYQYYEFQTVDKPLSEEEQAIMRQLSSRVAGAICPSVGLYCSRKKILLTSLYLE
jgi:hypothetical protein